MRGSWRRASWETRSGLDEVIRVAEGNPLFIEQLAAAIDETESGSLPTSVRALVAARLDALPRAERAVLIDAAVVGKVFWTGAVAAITSERADLGALLEELERRDLIRREDRSIMEGQEQFAFTHILIRDVAYDLLPRAERARRHALIAEFFESSSGVSGEAIGAIARHWRDAGNHPARGRPARARRGAGGARLGEGSRGAALPAGAGARAGGRRGAQELHPAAPGDRGPGVVPSRRRQTGGKSAGVTSPAISSIEATSCWPSRSECSTTMSAVGAS